MWHTVCFGSIDVGAELQQVVISFPRVCQGAPTLFDNDNDSAECHLLITSLHSYSGHCLFFLLLSFCLYLCLYCCVCVLLPFIGEQRFIYNDSRLRNGGEVCYLHDCLVC